MDSNQRTLWSEDREALPVATGKRLLEGDFPIEEISQVAEAESWRKEVHRPIYHVHKWWACRLGSVFRAIILGAALEDGEDLMEHYYSRARLDGLTVFDPFMGSGTTVGEALKLGCTAVGRDINPVAYNAVRAALGPYRRGDLEEEMERIDERVGDQMRSLYRTVDLSGMPCEVLYFFWVKEVDCPKCEAGVRLFSSYVFSKHAYVSRRPLARIICPSCWGVSAGRYDSTEHICPDCGNAFDPQDGPVRRTKATCSCGHTFPVIEAVRTLDGPPVQRMYAKMILRADGTKMYERITDDDLEAYRDCERRLEELPDDLPAGRLAPGYNTNQAIGYGYTEWKQFFNARQRLALTLLAAAICEIKDPDVRFAFTILFSGTLEFNNVFASFKGEGTGAVRHMFAHHTLKPERTPVEANVWGTPKSSGAFTTLFRSRLLRALDYREHPHELKVEDATGKVVKVAGISEPFLQDVRLRTELRELYPGAVHLSCGDSSHTNMPSGSVDLVVTDPPFFDNVHYSELADFFYSWQQVLLPNEDDQKATSTRSVCEVQDSRKQEFARKLGGVLAESNRVLKSRGLLAFSYHHSRNEGWESVAEAVTGAGFRFVAAQPVKSEMSVAAPKSQAKHAIDLDIILVCRKSEDDLRSTIPVEDALSSAIEDSNAKCARFAKKRMPLTVADKRIIYLSSLLVELSAGRDSEALVSAFANATRHAN